ncbi:hypothetical protein [Pseudoalteromonas galatheae]|uniref:hypothetical protein n=1 Tax=Pseudoalteromonas galatheae TaxID=579562 RepID=UPI0030D26610
MAKGDLKKRLAETDETVIKVLLETAFGALNDVKTQKRVAGEMDKSEEFVNGVTGLLMALVDLPDDNAVNDWMPVKTMKDLETFIAKVEAGEPLQLN